MFINPCDNFIYSPIEAGDKSITHRALILGSIAKGQTEIFAPCISDDIFSTISCLRILGANVQFGEGNQIIVSRLNCIPNKHYVLDCGNSATTARLLAGVVAGLGIEATFTGDASLRSRPMEILDALAQMGARTSRNDDGSFFVGGGKLHGIDYTTKDNSAQTKSAILLAGLFADGETIVREKMPTRDHTENMLAFFGAYICRSFENENFERGANFCSQHKGCNVCEARTTAAIVRPSQLFGQKVRVPFDCSTAAYIFALALCRGSATVEKVCTNIRRTGFLRLLESGGAHIEINAKNDANFEPCADITVKRTLLQPLKPHCVPIMDIIDEIPIAAVVAATTHGVTKFTQLKYISVKESNRIKTTAELLQSLGVRTTFDEDSLTVFGNGVIKGGFVKTYGDHRIAMSAVVAGMLSQEGVEVDDVMCISVSCSEFLKIYADQQN